VGGRGPSAKPTAIRVLHGDEKRRINLNEPQPNSALPITCPEWLSEYAKEEWHRLEPHFVSMGILKGTDQASFALYCEAFARWRQLLLASHKSPPVFKSERHEGFVKNPIYSQLKDAAVELRLMLREFGLTPSARAGIRVTVTNPQPAERLFTKVS
jgi:P27 family predicted phage terminase small subunit